VFRRGGFTASAMSTPVHFDGDGSREHKTRTEAAFTCFIYIFISTTSGPHNVRPHGPGGGCCFQPVFLHSLPFYKGQNVSFNFITKVIYVRFIF